MAVTEAIFWVSLLSIVYPYAGYPAVLWLRFRLMKKSPKHIPTKDTYIPSVTIVISAYNEENVIGEKIENTLALDFPKEILEIVIVSDGSNDRTCEIASNFADRGVVLRHFDERIGKTACLNSSVPLATGKVVVFSDANSAYEKGALLALLRPFQDDSVGFVTGWTQYGTSDGRPATSSIGLYTRLELMTKELESRLGSCIGADGAIFAIRKELYRPLNNYDINDFVIPLSINERGYRGVLERGAVCFEKDAGGDDGEFQRQVRISNRTIRAIINYHHLLNPLKYGWFSVGLFSHKLCKFLVPAFLITLFVSCLLLSKQDHLYVVALISQMLFYGSAVVCIYSPNARLQLRFMEPAILFVLVNIAMALAWIRYFQGHTYSTWAPTKR